MVARKHALVLHTRGRPHGRTALAKPMKKTQPVSKIRNETGNEIDTITAALDVDHR